MSALICGSLAFDTIMGEPRRFASTARMRGERPRQGEAEQIEVQWTSIPPNEGWAAWRGQDGRA